MQSKPVSRLTLLVTAKTNNNSSKLILFWALILFKKIKQKHKIHSESYLQGWLLSKVHSAHAPGPLVINSNEHKSSNEHGEPPLLSLVWLGNCATCLVPFEDFFFPRQTQQAKAPQVHLG